MNIATRICKENKHTTVFVLMIWFAACICAICCSTLLDGSAYGGIAEYVEATVSEQNGIWKIAKNGLAENLKFIVCILICSLHTIFIPLTLALMAFKGFSAGFTAAILIRVYQFKGAFMCFFAIVIPLSLSLMISVAVAVIAVRFPFLQKREHPFLRNGEKRNMWLSYVALQLGLGAMLCVITFIEAVISYFIF